MSMIVNLEEFGIMYKGPLEEIVYIQRDAIPRAKFCKETITEPYSHAEEITIQKSNGETTSRRFYIGPILSKGSYGFVEYIECYETIVDNNDNKRHEHHTIVRKRSQRQHHSLFLEACLQYAAYKALEEAGLHNVIARVTDIYRLPGGNITFSMEALRNVEKVSDALEHLSNNRPTSPSTRMDELIVSILAQVAVFVHCLESKLCLNHRDMKCNNILITRNAVTDTYINTSKWKIYAPRRIYIVDFGFACIGSTPPPVMPAILSDNEFFSDDDGCPKKGRDLFQLLSFLYMVESIRTSASKRLLQIIEKCLHINVDGINYCDYLSSTANDKRDNIYDIISGGRFEAPLCEPTYFLNLLATEYPNIVHNVI
jgi:thiamine kinase-like enzyme